MEVASQSRAVNRAQVGLHDLESSAQISRAIYDNFLQRYAKSLQQQQFPISDARILAAASPPTSKSGPKTLLILAMAAAGGLAFAVAVGILRELMNRSLYTSEQVESTLQTPCISLVPLMKSDKGSTLTRDPKPMISFDQGLATAWNKQRIITHDQNVIWAVLNSPFSRFAESIRSIKLAIDLDSGASNKVIGFTSSLPGEGKSTIAASVALLMAQTGARVILVDCDLRNPSLSGTLAPDAEHGILEVIAGRVPLEDAVWTDPSSNLTFLPAVIKTRHVYSSEVLAADATEELIRNLQSRYDYVLVDLTPLLPVVDTRATTGLVDCYICVVEWGRTKIDCLEYAFRDAQNISEKLLGVILNKADVNRLSRHYPGGEHYYRNKYYPHYGITE